MTSIKRMSGLEINVVVNEIKQQLLGLRVVNVYSVNKRTYLIKLSGTNSYYPASSKAFLLVESGVRIHCSNYERELESTPNGLANTIRRHLKGKSFANIEQCGLDRVVRLEFGIGPTAFNLFIELFGTGNIVFTDCDYNILALLKQQAYGTALLGSSTTATSTNDTTSSTSTTNEQPINDNNGLNQQQTDSNNNGVALRSKYQWDQQLTAVSFPPQQLNAEFVLSLFKNKHQRILEQLQMESQLDITQQQSQQSTTTKGKTNQRKKDKSQQVTVKHVLYESILGPQLCLHGCNQFIDLDLNQLYTTVLTDGIYLDKLVKALRVGLDYYYKIIKECSGYLHCRLTTTITNNYDKDGKLIDTNTNNMLVTADFSPGNLSQTTISPTVYIPPQSISLQQTQQTNNNTNGEQTEKIENGNNNNDEVVVINNTTNTNDEELKILFTSNNCSNKINTYESISLDKNGKEIKNVLYQTFELPHNGYQTFNWGIVKPTSSVTNIINTNDIKDDKKSKKQQQQVMIATNGTPITSIQTIMEIKDIWFYCKTFSNCVDIYYGTKEVEKEIQRIEREKFNVLSRIEKTKLEQQSKLQNLQESIDMMLLKAQLIENNQFLIQQAINAVQQQLQRGRDWVLIADIIQQQKQLLNPVALLIDKLNFSEQSMIVSLSWELEHIQIFMQNEFIKRNKEKTKLQQQHIIHSTTTQSQSTTQNDDDDNNDDDNNNQDDDNDEQTEQQSQQQQDDNDEDDDERLIVDENTEESIQAAKDDKEDERIRLNTPGSWKKPVKITINFTLSTYANAQTYYSHVKELTRKKAVAEQFSEQTIKSIEKKGQKELHQVKEVQAKQRRKVMWFEKFYWFITSENFLVVGGRDATQNELLVKRYLDTNDIYFHADIHGASSVVVKVPHTYVTSFQQQYGIDKPIILPLQSLIEIATFTTCHSNAWVNKTNNIRSYWVYAHQVSKIPPTGLYLEKGSFMIRGNKNYIEPQPLQMGVGLLFRAGDDETILNHQNERPIRTMASSSSHISSSSTTSTSSSSSSTASTKATSIFQAEQNKKQQQQEETIARLEAEDKQRKLDKLQRQKLKDQTNTSITNDTTTTTTTTTTTPNDDNNEQIDSNQPQQQQVQTKRILSKNDRYQMKKLGITDPAKYWEYKKQQSESNNNDNTTTKSTDDTIVPDENNDEYGDDIDPETGQVPEWLQKSKDAMGINSDHDEDDDEDDEDNDSDEDNEYGEDVDENGLLPLWLQREKEKMGIHSDDDDEDEDNDDDEEYGDDIDPTTGKVPQWLQKTKALLGGSDDDNTTDDDEEEEEEEVKSTTTKTSTTTPKQSIKPSKNTKSAQRRAKQRAQAGGDSDDDEGIFDPTKFLSKNKKALLLTSSSDDENNKKKPQHGINRKKGNTKQARLAKQEEAKRAAEETKALRQRQAQEREDERRAKQLAKQQLKQTASDNNNGSDEFLQQINDENNNIGLEDDDELNEVSLQKLQQQRLEMEGTEYVLSTLTAKPLLGDYLTHAIPMVAPYSALQDYLYKVKLVPGGGKKGLTIKDSTHVFTQAVQSLYKHPPMNAQQLKSIKNANANIITFDKLPPEEQAQIQKEKNFQNLHLSLIKQISDAEFSLTMMSNAKVSVQGIQQVHKQQKIQKKLNAKQKEKQKK